MEQAGVQGESGQAPAASVSEGTADLARELTGDLHCARCGYNLRGLSVLSMCAECGLPVKATILAIVDPHADELREIRRPRVTQVGILMWTGAAFLAAVCLWGIRAEEVLNRFFDVSGDVEWLARAAVWLAAASGVGALVLVRPHEGIERRDVTSAVCGVLCYVPMVLAMWWMLFRIDAASLAVYATLSEVPAERSALRLVFGVSVIGITLLLRSNALKLAYRSVLVRTGRVDRQPLRALAAAAGVGMVGDLIHLAAPSVLSAGAGRDIAISAGTALIASGSFLLTVGLWGVTLDAWRIRRVISAPGIGLTDIFDDRRSDEP